MSENRHERAPMVGEVSDLEVREMAVRFVAKARLDPEFGLQLPAEVGIRVADSNQKTRYMATPVRPEGTEE